MKFSLVSFFALLGALVAVAEADSHYVDTDWSNWNVNGNTYDATSLYVATGEEWDQGVKNVKRAATGM